MWLSRTNFNLDKGEFWYRAKKTGKRHDLVFNDTVTAHLALLPQGQPERKKRVISRVAQMDKEGFGACTNTGACEATCPKDISLSNIARLNQEYLIASLTADK